MKSNVTYIDACEFETIILESGLPAIPQKGFVKVQGPQGRAVYVANTKRVGRVDISGFEMEGDGFVVPHCGVFGNVRQQLDMGLTKDEILANFRLLLITMKSLAPVEKPQRKPATPKADAPKGFTRIDTSPEAREAAKAKRKELIEKVARETGKPISPNAFPTEA